MYVCMFTSHSHILVPFQFDEMVTDEMVVSQIEQNRGGYEDNVRQLAAPVAAQLCSVIVAIEQIVV